MLSCIRRPGFNVRSELVGKREIGKEKEKKRKEEREERRGKREREREREREKREEEKVREKDGGENGFRDCWVFQSRLYNVFGFSKKVSFKLVLRRNFIFEYY